MFFQHLLVYVACAWCVAADGLTTNKTLGTAYFEGSKNIQWTIAAPNEGLDTMLVVNVIKLQNYNIGKRIFMPDGNLLVRRRISFTNPLDAWCGIYVSPNSKACQAGKIFPDICNKTVNVSSSWPAKINIETSNPMYILFTYTFFPCTIRQETGTSTPPKNTECDPMTGTFAILGVLLAISVLLSAALLFQSIREKQKYGSRNDNNKPPGDGQVLAPQSVRGSQRTTATFAPANDDTYQTPVVKDSSTYENPYQGLNNADANGVYNQLAH